MKNKFLKKIIPEKSDKNRRKKSYGITYPRSSKEFDDMVGVVEKYITSGYYPQVPIINQGDTVTTMGSCFAINMGKALAENGINTVINRLHEEANSPLANTMLLDYIINGEKSEYCHTFKDEFNIENSKIVLENLRKSKCLIFTAGVGICCFHKKSGELLIHPNSLPIEDIIWEFPSQETNAQYLQKLVELIRSINPDIHIIITVSPVPLYRAITTPSPFVEDCVSKSLLRAAVHDLMGIGYDNLYYWPTFEMFRWLGGHIGPVYGNDDDLPRHVSGQMVDMAIKLFLKGFSSVGEGREDKKLDPRILTLIRDA